MYTDAENLGIKNKLISTGFCTQYRISPVAVNPTRYQDTTDTKSHVVVEERFIVFVAELLPVDSSYGAHLYLKQSAACDSQLTHLLNIQDLKVGSCAGRSLFTYYKCL
jgi:hypothetical protein